MPQRPAQPAASAVGSLYASAHFILLGLTRGVENDSAVQQEEHWQSQWHTCGSGDRQVYIETSSRPQYTPTRRFYLQQNYEIAAVFPDFYNTGDDKVVLVKQLS